MENQNMKYSVYASTLSAAALLVGQAAAQPLGQAVLAPATKQATQIAPALKATTTFTRRRAQYAPQESCVYEAKNFQGIQFCTRRLGLQLMPTLYQHQMSSASVTEGYKLILYENLDKTGGICVFYGDADTLGTTGCDDMAVAISLEVDPEYAPRKAAEEQARAQAEIDARGFASNRERDQAAAKAEEDARIRRNAIASLGPCPVELLSTDGPYPNRLCLTLGQDRTTFGGSWNDDIERIKINSPYLKAVGYEHFNYQGNSIDLTCGDWELIGDPENEISSIRVEYVSLGGEVHCPTTTQERHRWGYGG
jgi:hypothetical protein